MLREQIVLLLEILPLSATLHNTYKSTVGFVQITDRFRFGLVNLTSYPKTYIYSVILGRLCLNIYTPMAVPKKKTSKSKRDKRRATWVNKAAIQAKKALSLGKSVLTGRSTSFVYPQPDEDAAE